MRCTCCGRAINPANAYRKTHAQKFDGSSPFVAVGVYGPVCAVKLGLTKPAPKLKRKPSRFAIFSTAVKQDTDQPDFFGVAA